MNERDEARLRDMLDEALRVRKFIQGRSRADLDNDDMLTYAFIRAVEIIGEAAARITEATRTEYPQIAWKYIVEMRNRIIHDYNNVDLNIGGRLQHATCPN
jgi:uncharacterized protein with HEPN domain